ncbi:MULTISPECIES: helix-turn-helix domain-containing protein [unclassified Leeuwenhoekiella]|uniref:helix-turn-helix domain-containing protein n=1 Tax=unclassified Leeuwenhoekiella TaxID=2615029 RepID=UPI000C4E4B89|nr:MULTISPECIES: helix-turn-helix domain-containing protein [unclassified Leeuwenhoekiella]MAW94319.1 DNA-binding protein [Leeuwenhoekiella sp.]MBA83000.1 DNA-binding protein [Leeuwenhoekiella sp.]|tara:strand:- start:5745 stop:6029 length:285 start_codon:yes stop_codon:yes gene_type:complete
MPATLITTDDLREFKRELLNEIKTLLNNQGTPKLKKYLKSSEVMELLQVSPGTLQNLRINGTLPFTKVGGLIYYDADDIQKVMEDNRVNYGLKP